ncbi:uncharacterized protein PFL1_04295 [Pseudozyma flocculosa PF-1]|uniref:NAD-dependent protein deacylase n=2 Tax=Pseudozyma flocculosa TaxID=84751 RepID=A0A5C3FB10_9BASI|nr:uncharacterized protein PFL1_04295 [Pseudozyma flocculosa PF-1]EPQ27968.1 hypothetical protein PFL1_04295 [Pseudozyma flocculosa PF-1]SPO41644.1 related to NAD-dependent deacetylase Sirtuin 5 [Pseudozyma flocculosa]
MIWFQTALHEAKRPVALAGAGLSAASGIPTFRGAGGLWRQHDALSLATPEAFQRDPSKVWQFYHYRRTVCLAAKPNPAHMALAKLLASGDDGSSSSTPSLRQRIMPKAESFHLITQNVDGLSGRAMAEVTGTPAASPPAASANVLEMHGNIFKTICTRCRHSEMNYDNPIAPALAGSEDLSQTYRDIPLHDLPRCRQPNGAGTCDGLLRPGVVWFGESIPQLDQLEAILEGCDLILVLGTSSTVYPAAGFAQQVKRNRSVGQGRGGGRVAVFNIDERNDGGLADWHFQGPVEELLPKALGLDSDP